VKRIRNVKKEQTEEISPQNRKMSLRDSKILWSKVKVESFAFSEATMKVLKTNKIQNLLELVNIYISSNGNLLNLRSTNEYVSEEIIEILKRYIPEIDDIKEMFNSQLVQ